MRLGRLLIFAALLTGIGLPQTARAYQRNDWYVAAGEEGTFLDVGFFFPGIISSIEHRLEFYGANEFSLKGTGILTYPMGDAQVDVNLRFLILTIGGGVGFRDTWRNFTFEPDEPISRKARRERSASGQFDSVFWPSAEGRVVLSLPFNDYLLFNCVNTARYEDSPDRTYDWRNSLVHDNGMLYKSEPMLFVKHRKWGAIGPTLQILDFSLDGERHTQLNYGFTFVTRAGLTRWNDIIAVQMTFYGDTLDGFDNSDIYGSDMWRGPWNLMLAYFSIIPL